MKRNDLLLLTFLLSQTAPLWAMDEPDRAEHRPISAMHPISDTDKNPVDKVNQLQQLLINAQREIEKYSADLLAGEKVFVLGATRAGKSTIVNLLAGKPLEADARGRLDTKAPVKGSEIGHETSMTPFPSLCQGPDNMVLCDFPGYGDTESTEKDLIHACIRNKLFSGKFKILFAVEEGDLGSKVDGLLSLMHYITQEIPVNQLKGSFALVVTKYGMIWNGNPHQRLKEILETKQKNLTADVRELLLHLTDEENIHTLIPYFPLQKTAGEYQSEEPKTKILEAIHCLKPILNPKVQLQLAPESTILISKLGHNLNKELTTSLDKLRHKIVHLCKTQTNAYASDGNMVRLETNLRAIQKALLLLEHDAGDNIVDFTHPLDTFFDQDHNVVKEYAKTLMFLKTVKSDIDYSKGAWARTLQLTLDDIHESIDTLANKLFQKITTSLETINDSIRCEVSRSKDNIKKLENTLGAINESVGILQGNPPENIPQFAHPLKDFLSNDPNTIESHMGPLEFLKTLKKIDYPIGMWTRPFNVSIEFLNGAIDTQQKIIALKEQNARLEEQEERARVAAEAAERQHLADLEAHRLAREEAAARLQALEAQAALDREEREAERAQLLQQLERQRQQLAEEHQAQAAAIELQRLETNRLTAEVELGRQRLAALAIMQHATDQEREEQAEANRQLTAALDEQRRAQAALLERQRITENQQRDIARQAAEARRAAATNAAKINILEIKKDTLIRTNNEKDTKIKSLERENTSAKAKMQLLRKNPKKPVVKVPAPQPKKIKTKISMAQYTLLKKGGATNIEAVNAPHVTYHHRKGHIITKATYDERKKKGKTVRMNPPGGKFYYRIDYK